MRRVTLATTLAIALLFSLCPGIAEAGNDESDESDQESMIQLNPSGITTGSELLANFDGSFDLPGAGGPVDEVEDPIAPVKPAQREHVAISFLDVLCADQAIGLAPVTLAELDGLNAAAAAVHKAAYGATGGEILAFINAAEPMTKPASNGTRKAVTLKRNHARQDDVYIVDSATTSILLNDIAAAAADAETNRYLPSYSGPALGCTTPYQCAGERIDDILLGHIDSEPDGAYHEYVNATADRLTTDSESVRVVESQAPGNQDVDIAVPNSSEGVQSLTTTLAEQGLDQSPTDLHLPIFNYCRRGINGEIETDPAAEPQVLPSFTWTPVTDEFDIPGASAAIFDGLEAELRANLPDINTIPPHDTGVTIVKFPMWLWLTEPLLYKQVEAFSDAGHLRIRGRARLDHVTWTLGEHTLTCTLDDMKEYVPNTGMHPGKDRPPCHHIFTKLVDFDITATITYRIEQQVSRRLHFNQPIPDTAWQPHPTNPQTSIQNTTGQISVREIPVVNTAPNYTRPNSDSSSSPARIVTGDEHESGDD